MKSYPVGHQFKVPTLDQLVATGWTQSGSRLNHSAWVLFFHIPSMVLRHGGQTLEVAAPTIEPGWYLVYGSSELWPVEACEIATMASNGWHRGVTPPQHTNQYPTNQHSVGPRVSTKNYPAGYRFQVPTENDCTATRGVYLKGGEYRHTDIPGGFVSTSVAHNFGGKILTVVEPAPQTSSPGWYRVEEGVRGNGFIHADTYFYHVEFCERIMGPISQAQGLAVRAQENAPYAPAHRCSPGMTPIDGWIICKDCGKNLTKLGS